MASTLIAPSRPAATARTSDFERASSASARSSDHTRAFGMSGIVATACWFLVEGMRAGDAQPESVNSARTISSFLDQATGRFSSLQRRHADARDKPGHRPITENLDG